MKILVATGIYPPSIGGPATYSKMLFDELPSRGIEVDVLSFDEVRHLPKIIRHLVYFFKVIFRLRGVDLVYAQDPVSVGLPSQLAAQLFFKPFLLRLGGDYAWEQSTQRFGVKDSLDVFAAKRTGYAWPVLVLKKIQTHVAFWADAVVVPSAYLKSVIVAWGIREERVKVIHNTFELTDTFEDKTALRKEYGFSDHAVITVARLVPWKGLHGLISAIATLHKDIPSLTLHIVGDGPDHETLKKHIAELGAQQYVTMHGALLRQKTVKMCKAAHIFVLNSSYEGFSHLLLEAMAMKTPIITTTAGGNVELVQDGVNGLVVPVGDTTALANAIRRLFKDTQLGHTLVTGGEKRLRDFSSERVLAELIRLLRTHGTRS